MSLITRSNRPYSSSAAFTPGRGESVEASGAIFTAAGVREGRHLESTGNRDGDDNVEAEFLRQEAGHDREGALVVLHE
jgi:hypothetical protein